LFPLKTEPKVDEYEIEGVVVEEEKVFGFEVTMCNIIVVTVVDNMYDL
jgi:hypothetical protein